LLLLLLLLCLNAVLFPAGFPLPSVVHLWMLVVFIIVAALVAMFAGSVLSMLVLPTLASHAVSVT
jgi:hypothetical protein